MRQRPRLTLFFLFCCSTSIAFSQQVNQVAGPAGAIDFRFGGGHTDNVFRQTLDPVSDTYSLVGFSGGFSRASPRLDTVVAVDIERRNYSDPSIEDEPYGSVDANVEVGILPNRITWLFSENFGQAQIDPFVAQNPLNQEQVNIFSTGPSFNLPLGQRTSLDITARREKREYEETFTLDSESESADVGISRAVNATTFLGLTVNTRRIEYDIPLNDNRVNAAYFSYRRQLSSGDVYLALGQSEVEFDVSGDSSDAPYLDLSWSRDVGARGNLSISGANQISDFGAGFGWADIDPDGSPSRPDNALLSPDVFEQTSAAIDYSIMLPRGGLSFGSDFLDAKYQNDAALDYDWFGWTISYQRPIGMRLTFDIVATAGERTFEQTGVTEEDSMRQVRLQRGFGQRMSLDFAFQRYSRSGNGAFNYDEDTYRITFRYGLNRQPLSSPSASR